MPLDRADAVVIGAGVEGLAAALALARGGKQILCADRRETIAALGRPDEAWARPSTLRALGLFGRGLRLTAPAPHLTRTETGWRALWPDAARTARTLPEPDASAFLETIAQLRRWRAMLAEPGAAGRAMLACLDLIRKDNGQAAEFGLFLRDAAVSALERRSRDPQLHGLLIAMAARRAPANPDAAGSAAMLLSLASFFDDAPNAPRLVAGGQPALIAALAEGLREAGGDLALGHQVSEISMDREAVAGVAFAGGGGVKSPAAIAALAPRRLAQGLLSTRRYGRLLSGLRAAPRRAQAMAGVVFGEPPDIPDRRAGLWNQGVSVWLGASIGNLRAAAGAMERRTVHPHPIVELRFDPGLRTALAVAPFCPGELKDGPWTEATREALLKSIVETIKTQWPQAGGLIEEARLIAPRALDDFATTGAIFGAPERMPDLDAMFALGGETHVTLLKGLSLCVAQGFEPDGQAGVSLAARLRA